MRSISVISDLPNGLITVDKNFEKTKNRNTSLPHPGPTMKKQYMRQQREFPKESRINQNQPLLCPQSQSSSWSQNRILKNQADLQEDVQFELVTQGSS